MNARDKVMAQMSGLWDAVGALQKLNDFDDADALLNQIEDLRSDLIALTPDTPIPQLSDADVKNLQDAQNALETAVGESQVGTDVFNLATQLANL
jgi:hypothetical protein